MEWGAPDAPPVIMWHGLARTGRDFDELAQALADDYRIICPDAIGRGLSQWSPDPVAEYRLDFYARRARWPTGWAWRACAGSARPWAAPPACTQPPPRCATASRTWW